MTTNQENSDKIVGGYVPVIHQGYIDIFNRYPDHLVGIFDKTISSEFDYLRKDIRALDASLAAAALRGLGMNVVNLSLDDIQTRIQDPASELVLFDDDVSHTIVDNTEEVNASIRYDSPFLRWDRNNTKVNVTTTPDRTVDIASISVDDLFHEAAKSSDWWRHVGAGLISDGNVILRHNRALPNDYVNFIDGDPRIAAGRGQDIDKSLFIHAEADLIAHMAKEGIRTEGESIYVTTFPCPSCAKLIAASGFKACYFVEGYAMLDGENVLKSAGIEIIKIDTKSTFAPDQARLRPYPEK